MWVAKIKANEEGTLIGEKAIKYKINLFAFPLSYYYEKEGIVVQITGTLLGEEKDKKAFLRDLKGEKRVVNFELNDDFFIGIIKEPSYMKFVYNKEIIHLAPALISDKGYEIVTLGCFEREHLMKIVDILKEKYNGELISIQEKKVSSISIMKVHPELTKKQKKAIELAIKNGYYHVPRKISVEELAKLSKLSFSTYQVHLRKAEAKLMPYFFE